MTMACKRVLDVDDVADMHLERTFDKCYIQWTLFFEQKAVCMSDVGLKAMT